MFCGECGNKLPEGARFCGACGAALVPTGEAQSTSVPSVPAARASAARGAAAELPRQQTSFGYWAYKALAVGIPLLALLVLARLGGPSLIPAVPAVLAVIAAIGACLWILVTGRWPGTRRRAHPLVRGFIGLIPIGVNGFAAVVVGYLAGSDCDYICAGLGPVAGTGWGIGAFLALAALETIFLLLAVGVVKLVRFLWRGGRRAEAF